MLEHSSFLSNSDATKKVAKFKFKRELAELVAEIHHQNKNLFPQANMKRSQYNHHGNDDDYL